MVSGHDQYRSNASNDSFPRSLAHTPLAMDSPLPGAAFTLWPPTPLPGARPASLHEANYSTSLPEDYPTSSPWETSLSPETQTLTTTGIDIPSHYSVERKWYSVEFIFVYLLLMGINSVRSPRQVRLGLAALRFFRWSCFQLRKQQQPWPGVLWLFSTSSRQRYSQCVYQPLAAVFWYFVIVQRGNHARRWLFRDRISSTNSL
jgi:hypothetical protein